MYQAYPDASTITAIVPESCVQATLEALNQMGHDVMNWSARGSLKDTRWYRRFLPAFSPEKGLLRVIACNSDVDSIIQLIVETARLDRNATGAVFAQPADQLTIGGLFHTTCKLVKPSTAQPLLKESLELIQCAVDINTTEPIARAAIDAGSHGPVINYGEGIGLRDRLGWLRITKQREKEVMSVITDRAKANQVFNAMAAAGNIDQPGNGFIYQMPIEKGLFNLPSFYSGNQQTVDMQQVISAIDQLLGHQDWRDSQSLNDGSTTQSTGINFLAQNSADEDQSRQCVTVIVDREHVEQLTDMALNAGAKGISLNYAQLHTADDKCLHKEVKLVNEYGIMRIVTSTEHASELLTTLASETQAAEIEDACLFSQPVNRMLTYIHKPRPERRRETAA